MIVISFYLFFFFFKQKTAYEMRISDWSSDVCSSDLIAVVPHAFADHHRYVAEDLRFGSDLPVLMTEKDAVKCQVFATDRYYSVPIRAELPEAFRSEERRVGKECAVRVDPGGRRIIKKKTTYKENERHRVTQET